MTHSVGKKVSFDEFKLYYDSTEKVTDRRLETNRWNYSICVAMLIAAAALLKWSLSTAALIWVGFGAVGIISLMAILFCVLWIGQIRDFKKLNNAKFAVLNEMAPAIEFDMDHVGAYGSYLPFELEWKKLQDADALERVGRSKLVAMKSSNIEYFIPRAFAVLFSGVLIAVIAVTVFDWPPTKLVPSPCPKPTASSGVPIP